MSGLIKKSVSTALLAISAIGFVAGVTACSKEEPVPPVVVPESAKGGATTPAPAKSDAKGTTGTAAAATPAAAK